MLNYETAIEIKQYHIKMDDTFNATYM